MWIEIIIEFENNGRSSNQSWQEELTSESIDICLKMKQSQEKKWGYVQVSIGTRLILPQAPISQVLVGKYYWTKGGHESSSLAFVGSG